MFQENISLLPYNTFGINAQCCYFVEYETVAELQEILQSDIFQKHRYLHIGAGSNLLFLNDFDGVILHSKIKGIEVCEETDEHIFFRVGAGEIWDDFVDFAVQHNYGGIENLSLIPGEVGSSAVQNIGAYGVEVKDVIDEVETIDVETGLVKNFTNAECRFTYRESIFKQEEKGKHIITHVRFRLSKKLVFCLKYGNIAEKLEDETNINLQIIRSLIIKVREEKLPDPKVLGNAGSFFMNPVIPRKQYESLKETYPNIPSYVVSDTSVKVPAGWLIEQCDWKGKSYGNAAVYEKQALVIVNKGGATALEIKTLSDQIIADVKAKFGIDILPEVKLI